MSQSIDLGRKSFPSYPAVLIFSVPLGIELASLLGRPAGRPGRKHVPGDKLCGADSCIAAAVDKIGVARGG